MKAIINKIWGNRVLKWVMSIAGVVLLGAVGSGVWELCLRNIATQVPEVIVKFISTLSSDYMDGVYAAVSRDPHNEAANFILLFVATSVTSIYAAWAIGNFMWVSYKIRKLEQVDKPTQALESLLNEIQKIKSNNKRRLTVFLFICFLMLISFGLSVFPIAYARQAAIFIDRSIEIVSPHIDEHSRLGLRAQFRSIETASDFYILEDRIRSIAKANSVKLPGFKSIR